jgi:antirestriction protein ArdC
MGQEVSMRASRIKTASDTNERGGTHPEWSQLLVDAVTKPGMISSGYSKFWNYSVGNQILAMFQCWSRGIQPGPIHTFRGWLDLGRHVNKGERALTLCMPVSVKRKSNHVTSEDTNIGAEERDDSSSTSAPERFTRFIYRNNWFVLSQTEGNEYEPVNVPAWAEVLALNALKVERVPFQHTNGNCQGYALARSVAVSPIAFMPHRTLFHEVAHVLLGHTLELAQGLSDDEAPTPRDLREVEAECVALICSESLALPGAEFSRGYIQQWITVRTIPERSAQRIFRVADEILRAGWNPLTEEGSV